MREISPVQNWILIAIVMAASGVLYDVLFSETAAVYRRDFALFIGMPILAFERKVLIRGLYRRIQSLPTLTFILAELFILRNPDERRICRRRVVALAKWLGLIASRPPGSMWSFCRSTSSSTRWMSALLIFVLRVRELLGRDVFISLLISRYRNPISEERVFLFIDLVDSTCICRKVGDLRAQQMLGSLFAHLPNRCGSTKARSTTTSAMRRSSPGRWSAA